MGITGRRFDLGAEQGIREAYAAHGGELYRYALRSLRDDGAAQDVVQEVFLRAWKSARKYDPRLASLRVWLFAIARNAIIDHVRRDRRPDPVATMPAVDAGFADEALDRWLVEEALSRLSADHRAALVETYLRGRSYREVAAELGIPQATLRSRVYFGLRALRLAMDEMGVRP
ncbi:RNA polymerase sigma-70 factor (ECF subfamily) [Saccharothrix tamanrassetensis]|uniref:RNA polymerase sigma-70 factor (ECF subfamily) n=1 Tax=Saccharothrix tamanrassetensis TaxID=1051531 RepID=A0A841CYN2_9PSEU|nr:sigma-70 family RNA polymerase sigma factor [Saccharothrix tamanrassetensis]MBB5960436.1 RNA polymerase sigma-70 factor (ECF subfamily) [Saccharothrix tamanrassetensis]